MNPACAWPRAAAFALGLFTLGAQSTLLREYLVLFRGSELAIGLFFAAWFLWVAASATLVARVGRLRAALGRVPALLLASYPVGAVAGFLLLVATRLLAGVPPYEPTPPGLLVAGALVGTLPVSLLTGALFPALCDLGGGDPAAGATRGYLAETLGAVAGGALSTLAFAAGVDGLTLTVALGLVPIGVAGARWRRWGRAGRVGLAVVGILSVGVLVPPLHEPVRDAVAGLRLGAVLAGASLVDERHTAYQLVTTADVGGQRVVLADGRIEATFPTGPDVEADAALLASEPRHRNRALVLGESRFGEAVALARYFGRVEVVALDGEALDAVAAAWEAGSSGVLLPPALALRAGDPRAFVREAGDPYDLILVAGTDPSSLLANRLYTVEFARDLAARLDPGGVVATSLLSGEDFLGTELLRYGQSIRATLLEVFPAVLIAPGEEATALASPDRLQLTLDSRVLAARYAAFAPSPPPFSPAAFSTRVREDAIEFVATMYASLDVPGDVINRDARPLATFLRLLTFLRQSGSPGVRLLWAVHDAGPAVAAALLAVLMLVVVRGRLRRGRVGGGYAAATVVAMAGGASISLNVLLLAAFQASVGAVYRELGAAAGLSMAGLACGAWAARRWARPGLRFAAVAWAVCAAAAFAVMPEAIATVSTLGPVGARVGFAGLFVLGGLVSGAAWPIAACGIGGDSPAAGLQAADHWGAALLGGATGVLGLALLGADAALHLLGAGLAGVAAVVLLDGALESRAASAWHAGRLGRALAFRSLPFGVLAGAVAVVGLGAWVLFLTVRAPDPGLSPRLDDDDLRRWETFTEARFETSPFEHVRLLGVAGPGPEAYVTATQAVAPDARGYGGPLNLLVSIGADGVVRRVGAVTHQETPSYVRGLPEFLKTFEGRDVRTGCVRAADGVDAMTGATVTRRAVETAVDRTCSRVGRELLGVETAVSAGASTADRLLDPRVVFVVLALAGALALHLRGSARWRWLLLAVSCVVGGAVFNLQLSASWLLQLARLEPPAFEGSAALFLLTVGVLGAAPLLGPIYCAHLCPFGAAQELLGRFGAWMGWRLRPPAGPADRARGLKYALLALTLLALFADAPASALAWDPLAAAFARDGSGLTSPMVVLALAASVPVVRFWCRVFCPVGAFFNLFNRLAGLIGAVPARRYGACDLGVKGPDDLDCLQCNRCARGLGADPRRPALEGERKSARAPWVYGVLVLATGAMLAWTAFNATPGGPTSGAAGTQGVRTLDVAKVLRLVQEGRLSDHEARYWRGVP